MSNLRFMAKLFSSCLSYFILQSISRGPTVILTTKRPDLALLVGGRFADCAIVEGFWNLGGLRLVLINLSKLAIVA